MQIYYFYAPHQTAGYCIDNQPHAVHQPDFVWLECTLDDIQDSGAWQQSLSQHANLKINDYHLADIKNLQHPSNFDSTDEYDILIFQKLVTPEDCFPNAPLQQTHSRHDHGYAITEWQTTPMTFIIAPHALITIRDKRNQSIDGFLDRINAAMHKTPDEIGKNVRLPDLPLDLTLRLLNVVIDRYLDIRLPLTRRINYWQNALLHSTKRFRQWQNLLQENMALQYIDYLCEEHIDVLQELRDDVIESTTHPQTKTAHKLSTKKQDLVLVRISDLINHVERVQQHVNRLETMIKTAIDLHFSALANQTNDNMRILAIITAVFSPLTLLTGIYGMNFEWMPGLKNHYGFWVMVAAMVVTVVILVYLFRRQHLVGTSQAGVVELLSYQKDGF